ncbi:uncharacterized protein BKCO1_5000052 [Diplodia corticola]|uniref:Uncharacterized protein n=1 Tax=Diplodia corticola TaxID=236234 RepID=A0A1J9QTJ1_9PEZI|nr:uncharacterized protein BKCO1_5000052 [Diplodia corticola]OJD31306.1 hypothetical protein BKCO1_5000052 [Diplodia corticola]
MNINPPSTNLSSTESSITKFIMSSSGSLQGRSPNLTYHGPDMSRGEAGNWLRRSSMEAACLETHGRFYKSPRVIFSRYMPDAPKKAPQSGLPTDWSRNVAHRNRKCFRALEWHKNKATFMERIPKHRHTEPFKLTPLRKRWDRSEEPVGGPENNDLTSATPEKLLNVPDNKPSYKRAAEEMAGADDNADGQQAKRLRVDGPEAQANTKPANQAEGDSVNQTEGVEQNQTTKRREFNPAKLKKHSRLAAIKRQGRHDRSEARNASHSDMTSNKRQEKIERFRSDRRYRTREPISEARMVYFAARMEEILGPESAAPESVQVSAMPEESDAEVTAGSSSTEEPPTQLRGSKRDASEALATDGGEGREADEQPAKRRRFATPKSQASKPTGSQLPVTQTSTQTEDTPAATFSEPIDESDASRSARKSAEKLEKKRRRAALRAQAGKSAGSHVPVTSQFSTQAADAPAAATAARTTESGAFALDSPPAEKSHRAAPKSQGTKATEPVTGAKDAAGSKNTETQSVSKRVTRSQSKAAAGAVSVEAIGPARGEPAAVEEIAKRTRRRAAPKSRAAGAARKTADSLPATTGAKIQAGSSSTAAPASNRDEPPAVRDLATQPRRGAMPKARAAATSSLSATTNAKPTNPASPPSTATPQDRRRVTRSQSKAAAAAAAAAATTTDRPRDDQTVNEPANRRTQRAVSTKPHRAIDFRAADAPAATTESARAATAGRSARATTTRAATATRTAARRNDTGTTETTQHKGKGKGKGKMKKR